MTRPIGWTDERGRRVLGKKFEHRVVAERALGKPLPHKAVVHHVDLDPSNNDPLNLVICPTEKYHNLLHIRTAALDACGNADWRKCTYCGNYDDTKNMREEKVRYVHRSCSAAAQRKNRERRRAISV